MVPMTTVGEWRVFLENWSREWLATDEKFPAALRKSGWLGFKPATEKQIELAEKRLGYRLPPSYRAFLLTSNGWRRAGPMTERIRPVSKVQWLEIEDPATLDTRGASRIMQEPYCGVTEQEYLSYDGMPTYMDSHRRQCLKISDPVAGDSLMYLLNPALVAEDGEWEAWTDAHWIPGAERFPSFAELMKGEYAAFRSAVLGDQNVKSHVGPCSGVYAPDRPRGTATRIGLLKPRPPRPTVEELVARLEDADPKGRKDAARRVFREFPPHDPASEKPRLVEPLIRILRSPLESDVRAAAACFMGSYGDRRVLEPLIEALSDPDEEVASAVLGALFYLSLYMKDRVIGDGIVSFLDRPRPHFDTEKAIDVLEQIEDPRLFDIGLRLLDSSQASVDERSKFLNDQAKFSAAFAVAKFGSRGADALLSRLASPDAGIRAAICGALREAGDKRAIEPLEKLLDDADEQVRNQVSMTLTSLRQPPPPELSEEDLAAATESLMESLRIMGIKLPDVDPEGRSPKPNR
jgi:HEAT repeat protein